MSINPFTSSLSDIMRSGNPSSNPKGMSTNYGSYDMSGVYTPSSGTVAGAHTQKTSNVLSTGGTVARNTSSSKSALQAMQDKAAKEAAAKEDALRNSLSHSFDNTIGAYKDLIGWLPNDQQSIQDQVSALSGTQKQSVNDATAAALGKYGGYRDEVASRQKQTLQDLADNTRNLFQAGNNYLGALGAGNSSATGMYSAALTQQANKQRADVQNQTNSDYNDINISEQDTRNQGQQQLDAIDQWSASQTADIVQQYQDLKRQLTTAYAGAKDSEKQALAQLDSNLFNSAINNLNNIKSMAAQYQTQVSGQIGNQVGNMSSMLSSVQSPSQNFQVGTITADQLQGMPNLQQDQAGDFFDSLSGNFYKKNDDGTYTQTK